MEIYTRPCKGSNVLDLFQRGWDELSAPNLKPVGMLTPHDLCAYINFMETVERLIYEH